MAEALRSVPQLTTLSLCVNRIGDAGARALALVLGSVPQLTTLVLYSNSIGEAGTAAVRAAAPAGCRVYI